MSKFINWLVDCYYSFWQLSRKQKIFRILAIGYAVVALMVLFVLVISLFAYKDLPSAEELTNYKHELPSIIYDSEGKQVFSYYDQKRTLLDDDKIPELAKKTLIASEDTRFYQHVGIDPIRIVKAFLVNLIHFRIVQGASTITQQTAKLYFLTPERTIKRKISEIMLALKMEKYFTKDQILGYYLNKAFFGRQSYGIEAAADTYFSKSAKDLSIAEMATLIGLLPAPSRYSPTVNSEAALNRRNIVLSLMEKNGIISDVQFAKATKEPIKLKLSSRGLFGTSNFFTEEVRKYLVNKYGATSLLQGGLKIYTTINSELQAKAQKSLIHGLQALEKRHGYRGPLANESHLDDEEIAIYYDKIGSNTLEIGEAAIGRVLAVNNTYGVIGLGQSACGLISLQTTKWARKYDLNSSFAESQSVSDLAQVLKIKDVVEVTITKNAQSQDLTEIYRLDSNCKAGDNNFVLELTPTPLANGAILSVDNRTGYVLAMSGGYSFGKSQFNRVIQSYRPAGSAFKPFVYLTALANNFPANSLLDDSPLSFDSTDVVNQWIPKNYTSSFTGAITMRDAIVYSKNIPTIRLANEVGINKIINMAKTLKVDTKNIPDNLSASLGSGSVNLWDMVKAYGAFESLGTVVDPIYILKVLDRDGKVLEENSSTFYRDLADKDSLFILNSFLQDVNTRGTGAASRAIGVPSAGKTGTTDENVNAWFVGFIPGVITGVYLGNDDFKIPLGSGETGGVAALPVWIEYMQQAKKYSTNTWPEVPETIKSTVVTSSGKLYCNGSQPHYTEYFKINQLPTECDTGFIDPNKANDYNTDENNGDSSGAQFKNDQL